MNSAMICTLCVICTAFGFFFGYVICALFVLNKTLDNTEDILEKGVGE